MSSAEAAEAKVTQASLTRHNGVATITFASDTGVNVFSSATLSALHNCVEQVAEDASVRFVVFRGSGKTFVAGADISEMSRFGEPAGKSFAEHGHHVFAAIEKLPQVTFAVINGHCLGGGCELAISCDFRLMSANGRIGQPEVKLGLIPGWGGTIRLPRLIGAPAARRLLFTGEGISAEQARTLGLVDEVVASPDELDACLERWLESLKHASPAAIKRLKHTLRSGDEVYQFATSFGCSDAHEGMKAFLEKRPAQWANWNVCE